MRRYRGFIRLLVPVLVCSLVSSCLGDPGDPDSSLSIDWDGDQGLVEGTIDSDTPEMLAELLDERPSIALLSLHEIDGSVDDEANLEAARMLREHGITTLVESDGLVASGGTDLFLAGKRRIVEPGACIGVHSWADGSGAEGADLPDDHPDHEPYLDYYHEMGIDVDFYWFTFDAAPADGMHWMSRAEMREFGVATERVGEDVGAEGLREDEG